jgi:hypothetical protein
MTGEVAVHEGAHPGPGKKSAPALSLAAVSAGVMIGDKAATAEREPPEPPLTVPDGQRHGQFRREGRPSIRRGYKLNRRGR